ncbi:type II secretion system protein GspM [Agaribacterium haliotis]|uniref:type II secretion system protein GspM n=1 Tax=Agaribacterium haliotis TaxID=2013869 RepID=UPI000BB53E26|nr:type II secretion system protein M [Agaribacterium haliotis]
MDAIKTWWQEASSRDQMAVMALAFALIIFALFSYVLTPVQNMADSQIARVEAQQAALERVKTLAAQWKNRKQSGAASSSASVEKKVQGSFAKHGLRPSGFDASGRSGIRVRFDAVEYVKLLGWLYDLELQQGMKMKDINLAASSDVGRVSASILIQKK